MTCIAAYLDTNGDIYMGGDSIGVLDYTYLTVKEPKIFRRKNMVFGYTTSFRMGQILQYDIDIPAHHSELKTNEYLISVFIPKIISKFEETKFLKIEDNQTVGGLFLIGYDKKIFLIEPTFSVLETESNYNSCGCGEDFARSAFWMMENKKVKPKDKVITALECASAHSLVKPPFHILKLPGTSGLN